MMLDSMYTGFSSSTGPFRSTHCVLGWSFKLNGAAEELDYSKLPPLHRLTSKGSPNVLAIWLPIVTSSSVLAVVVVVVLIVRRRRKYAEMLEDWELQYRPHRISYKDLFRATKGFKETGLLGSGGGFSSVYRGVLPPTKVEVAVKKVSQESRQGIKSFMVEISNIGQMRYWNLVRLFGYCRRKGVLLLVYDYMPSGSLDKLLYDHTKPALNWAQRFGIIKGVAVGLLYLHKDWDKVVIHRDIKPSNVLLDSELNGRLGDFGLVILYDHGADTLSTRVVGTVGYLAPELESRTGKATTATNVYVFWVFLLEVDCGRRPVRPQAKEGEEQVLMDWVIDSWLRGALIKAIDPRMGEEYNAKEAELVLKLGLICSHPVTIVRPSPRQVMQILDGDFELLELSLRCV